MKKFKRIASAIAALAMAATLAVPMSAMLTASAATELTLTVDEGLGIKEDKVYATQIFKLTFEEGSTQPKTIDWADDLDDSVKTALKSAVDVTSDKASDVAIKITATNADAVAKALAKVVGTTGDATGTYNSGKVTFEEDLADGYYLFTAIGTKAVLDGTAEAMSLGMLSIVNGAAESGAIGNGTAKIGLPTVEKKVLEDDHDDEAEDADTATYEDDAHWNDNADLDIGQEAKFGLYGTLPENYGDYDTYYYEFIDELSDVFEKPDPDDFVVTATGGATLLKGVDYTVTVEEGDGVYNISVKFTNLKTNKAVNKDTVITVKYTTALTDKAEAGKANLNEVKLKYSNNPNDTGEGKTGETPEDRVAVYTYDFKFEKTFWNTGSNLTAEEILAGDYEDLQFSFDGTGLKFRKTTEDDDFYGDYDYVVVPDDYEPEEDIVDYFELTLVNEDDERVTLSGDEEETDVAGYKLVVRIKGLDSDEYTLTEDKGEWTDFGYGELKSAEGTFTLESGITLSQEQDEFDEIDSKWSKGDKKDQKGYLEIQNKKGTELPSTGGIGTTLFYVVGGALVTVAGVTLITKKRVGDAE